jgi:two-component system, cell cycle sensor histidine kinase and response regulator CckA
VIEPALASSAQQDGPARPEEPEVALLPMVRSVREAGGVDGDWQSRLADALAAHFDAACARIWSLGHTAGRFRLIASAGLDIPFEGLQDNVPVAGTELGRVLTEGACWNIDCRDPATPPDVSLWADRQGVCSFIAAPIVAGSRPWGVCGLFTRAPVSEARRRAFVESLTMVGDAIAARGLAEERAAEPDLLASLAPCLSSAVVTLDRSGRVTHWNRAAEQVFGWTASQVMGRELAIVPPERAHEFAALTGDAACRITRTRTVCRRSDLRTVPVRRTSGPLYDRQGVTIGRIEVFDEESQQARLSRCLQVQGQVARILAGCRTMQEGLPLLLVALGEWLQCDVVEFWKRHEEKEAIARACVWARSPAEQQRRSSTEVMRKVSSEKWPAAEYRQDQIVYSTAHGMPHRTAANPPAGMRPPSVMRLAIPIRHDRSRLGIVVCEGSEFDPPDDLARQTLQFTADALAQFLERTHTQAALARSEASLRQTQKMDAIGLLAGGVAHDFNNLLTVILAYSEMGLEETDAQNPLHELFEEIQGAGQRAAAMTQKLLAVSRQQAARIVDCHLNQLISEMERMLQRLLGPSIALVHELDEDLGLIRADVNQMEQILLNLVVNARDAMPGEGRIIIRTRNVLKPPQSRASERRPQRCVELSVADTGCGMDEETRAKIFDPFFTTKEKGKGTGMGLATVMGIVQQSGGSIEVDSETGVGTAFHICFPRTEAALATQSIADEIDDLPGGSESILVVENDHSLRALIRKLLEVRGYFVLEAGEGREALQQVAAHPGNVDLLLIDLQMPMVEGIGLEQLVRQAPAGPTVLVMSGSAEPPAALQIDTSRQLLRKPFTSAELARKVRSAIDSR